jgi:hypothetical protein
MLLFGNGAWKGVVKKDNSILALCFNMPTIVDH